MNRILFILPRRLGAFLSDVVGIRSTDSLMNLANRSRISVMVAIHSTLVAFRSVIKAAADGGVTRPLRCA